MGYRLRYRQHDLDLPVGRFVIGRSASCQLSLDDPMVSRQHALLVVDSNGVTVEDLGSRNGVIVNDVRIPGRHTLADGDRIKIGSQEMVFLRAASRSALDTSKRAAPTARLPAFGVLGSLAEKALALGHGEEAERIIGTLLKDTLERVEGGQEIGNDAVDKASGLGLRIAALTGKGMWVDYVVRLYRSTVRPLPTPLVDELHELLRRVGPIDLALFRAYVTDLKARAGEMGPADRFLVSRIEGLERMASLR